MVVFCTSDRKSIGFDTHRTLRDGDSWVNTATYSKVLSAVRQAHCELSAVRQDFGVTLRQDFGVSAQSNAQGGDAATELVEVQSNAHCELSAEYKSSCFQARERLTPSLTYVATAVLFIQR
jgi:hypothetical protein